MALYSQCCDGGKVTIGRPLPNVSAYVLDQHMQLSPVGVVGELHIGGVGVARGYINNEDLTRARFVANPFGEGRLYKTGDMVKWLETGEIEYVGRMDMQVKLRGFRIELGEIEAVMAEYVGVQMVAAIVREDIPEKKVLVGYISPATVDLQGLKTYMASKLPAYMVPQVVVMLSELPVTSNGKVDRRTLPLVDAIQDVADTSEHKPRNKLEQLLLQIWAEVLNMVAEKISIYTSFFELGGHSLLATQVASRIFSTCGVKIPVKFIFQHDTIELLAAQMADMDVVFSDMLQESYSQSGLFNSSSNSTSPLPSNLIPHMDSTVNLRSVSYAQERMFVLHQLHAKDALYHSYAFLQYSELDIGLLHKCICSLVSRHEVLRTTFTYASGKLVQHIHQATQVMFRCYNVQRLAATLEQTVKSVVEAEAWSPFNLSSDSMVRCSVVSLGGKQSLVMLCIHHIATDGWSMRIIEDELHSLYRGDELPPLRIQYSDFAEWQRGWLQGEVLESQARYWMEKLKGELPVLQLPVDRPRPPVMSHRGATISMLVPPHIAHQCRVVSKGIGTSLFSYLLSCYIVLLHKYSCQEDIVVGIPIANRHIRDIEQTVGCFVNTLAIRTDVSDNPSFMELLRRVHDEIMDAHEHQDMPFEELVKRLTIDRSMSVPPVFQAMFSLEQYNKPNSATSVDFVSLHNMDAYGVEWHSSKVDVTMVVQDVTASEEYDGELSVSLEFNTDIFDHATADRILQSFVALLNATGRNPKSTLSKQDVFASEEEKHLILHSWSGSTGSAYLPQQDCVGCLFSSGVEADYEQIVALCCSSGIEVSYGQLASISMQLATELEAVIANMAHIKKEPLVGICVDQSSWVMVACILATWKAGCAYVPLDPKLPSQRLLHMVVDAKIEVILCQSGLEGSIPDFSSQQAPKILVKSVRSSVEQYNTVPCAMHSLKCQGKLHKN